MLNQCTFIGRLAADPEIKSFQSGDKVANLRLAVTDKWKDKNGEKQERTEWVAVAIFGPLADVAERYLRKGSKVFVQGQLRTRKWQDQSGNDRYSTEVVLQGPRAVMAMLDGAPRQDGGGQRSGGDGSQGHAQSFADELSDDIPFITARCIW